MITTALRVLAFAVAVVALVDPALTTSRSSRPLVSLLTADSVEYADLADRVERALTRRFSVVRGSLPAASGAVIVGDRVPEESAALPTMVIAPGYGTPFLRIISLDVPSTSSLNGRIPIVARMKVRGARGRHIEIRTSMGAVGIDHKLMPTEDDTVEVTANLERLPTMTGPAVLYVRARIEGTTVTDEATTVIDASENRLPVLFFDPRASWLSTFVRRAVERDPRFAVTHRVVTSRGVSNTAGAAPGSLRDAPPLSTYGTIVVGSPEQLTDADVSGLEGFMRERGGRVVLLMDRRLAGPIDRLAGASGWRAARLPRVDTLESEVSAARTMALTPLQTQEIAWPTTVPFGALVSEVSVARDSTRRPVVWSLPVGAGRLFVSGALDAWHHRDESSGFDEFWTTVVGELTSGAPNAVEVELTNRALEPGHATELTVWIRGAALSNREVRSATVSAMLVGATDTTHLRLWPGSSPGVFTGTVVAPREAGAYRIVASSGAERSDVALVVDPSARAPARDERHLMAAFASSRDGQVIAESQLNDLARALSSAVESVSRVETWHPMRSAWWIIPFALLLGVDWWWRRRHGLA